MTILTHHYSIDHMVRYNQYFKYYMYTQWLLLKTLSCNNAYNMCFSTLNYYAIQEFVLCMQERQVNASSLYFQSINSR